VYMSSGNRTKALEYYLKALKASEEIGMKGYVVGACGNIANVYIEMKNFELGLEYYQRGLKISEEIHDKNSEATTLGNIGTTYIYMVMDSSKGRLPNEVTGARRVKLNKAIEYIQRSLKVCQETGDIDIRQACYQNLTNAYKLSGDYKKALESEEHERAIQDSVFSQENAKKIVEQGMKYQFEKKEALVKADQEKKDALAVKELQKQKLVRNGFMGGFAVVLLFAGIFFSQRNKIKIGKKQSDELLLNILPAEVAEELKAKGAAEARLIDDVTVLFTDFKGFTELSEKLTPKELVAEINDCFSAFDHIMHKYGVEKIKTIGDAYMAAGGLPTPNKTHPQDVVNAALEIQQYMNDHKLKKEAANQLFFEIRIGVHTGPVVAGIVGIKKFQYDIWGDTVNTASRMESSGAVGKVNISETTYALVKDKFKCAYRGKVSAKGKGEIDMYFVG
jgi:adenylate cyclase